MSVFMRGALMVVHLRGTKEFIKMESGSNGKYKVNVWRLFKTHGGN